MVKSSEGVSFSSSSVAPFLRKCYEMVDDSSTDSVISWSSNVEITASLSPTRTSSPLSSCPNTSNTAISLPSSVSSTSTVLEKLIGSLRTTGL
uniref:Uncharacterized protein n=1 Tax=Brassica campestris TaxID=3711 RepID=A0A3P6A677_BRACM|nr:unnamed protein product [Brassica rapa]